MGQQIKSGAYNCWNASVSWNECTVPLFSTSTISKQSLYWYKNSILNGQRIENSPFIIQIWEKHTGRNVIILSVLTHRGQATLFTHFFCQWYRFREPRTLTAMTENLKVTIGWESTRSYHPWRPTRYRPSGRSSLLAAIRWAGRSDVLGRHGDVHNYNSVILRESCRRPRRRQRRF